VTLSATDNRIPHWMTEGLAVWEEHTPLRWDWVPMLYHAVTKDELFSMEDLTWGFVRPKKPSDRQLAYAQSYWICTYIEEKYGHDAILKMLDAFRTGASEEEGFTRVLGKSRSDFSDEFKAWTKQQIASWGYDKQTSERVDAMKEKGESLIKARQYDKAAELWEEIVKLRPVDALPHQRLAGLYLTTQVNKPEKAIAHLRVLEDVELKDNRYAKRIARLYRDQNQLPEAQKAALTAVYTDPYDLDAHQLLAEVAEKAGDEKALSREQKVIPVLEKWIEDNNRQRAE